MIDRVANAMRPLVDEIVVVSNAPDAPAWIPNARVVSDVLTGGGSAAGIHAALVAAQCDVLVVAWDMPFVTTEALREIMRRREDGKTSAAGARPVAAVVASHPNGMIEPLCAWYGPECVDAIASAWQAGDRSAHGIVQRVRSVIVPSTAFDAIGGTARVFFNVNTPADLDTARRIAGTSVDDETRRPT